MNVQQILLGRYNRRETLEEYFPNEFLGVADRMILNSIIRKQKVLGFEAFGSIIREMESFGYKTLLSKTYKPN